MVIPYAGFKKKCDAFFLRRTSNGVNLQKRVFTKPLFLSILESSDMGA